MHHALDKVMLSMHRAASRQDCYEASLQAGSAGGELRDEKPIALKASSML